MLYQNVCEDGRGVQRRRRSLFLAGEGRFGFPFVTVHLGRHDRSAVLAPPSETRDSAAISILGETCKSTQPTKPSNGWELFGIMIASMPKGCVCGRGGTQTVGNKMILPAWGQGEGGQSKAVYASWAASCLRRQCGETY